MEVSSFLELESTVDGNGFQARYLAGRVGDGAPWICLYNVDMGITVLTVHISIAMDFGLYHTPSPSPISVCFSRLQKQNIILLNVSIPLCNFLWIIWSSSSLFK